jgi:hypothetical protein
MTAPVGMPVVKEALAMEAPRRNVLQLIASRLLPQSAGLLSPEEQVALQRQGLLQLGMGLLANSGQRPVGSPGATFGERVGQAFHGVNLEGAVQQALQMREAYEQQAQEREVRKQVEAISAKYKQPRVHESPEQRYARFLALTAELSVIPGAGKQVAYLTNLLNAIKPQDRGARWTIRNAVDPQTGKVVMVRVNPETGESRPLGLEAPPQLGALMPTEGERRAGSLLTVGRNAWGTLQRNFEAPNFRDYALGKVPFGLGQAFTSKDCQQMMRAGADFGRSYLYLVSGAAVPPAEALGWAVENLPQLGDSPELIRDKMQALAVKAEAMEQAAGRARPGVAQPGYVPAPGAGPYDEFLEDTP